MSAKTQGARVVSSQVRRIFALLTQLPDLHERRCLEDLVEHMLFLFTEASRRNDKRQVQKAMEFFSTEERKLVERLAAVSQVRAQERRANFRLLVQVGVPAVVLVLLSVFVHAS